MHRRWCWRLVLDRLPWCAQPFPLLMCMCVCVRAHAQPMEPTTVSKWHACWASMGCRPRTQLLWNAVQVYYEPSCEYRPRGLDHALVLVGYGTDEKQVGVKRG